MHPWTGKGRGRTQTGLSPRKWCGQLKLSSFNPFSFPARRMVYVYDRETHATFADKWETSFMLILLLLRELSMLTIERFIMIYVLLMATKIMIIILHHKHGKKYFKIVDELMHKNIFDLSFKISFDNDIWYFHSVCIKKEKLMKS